LYRALTLVGAVLGLSAIGVMGARAIGGSEPGRQDESRFGRDAVESTALELSVGGIASDPSGRSDFLSAVSALGGGFVSVPRRDVATRPRWDASAESLPADVQERPKKPFHELYFTRGMFPLYRGVNSRGSGFGNRGRCGNHRWCTDWPEADEHLSGVIQEALDIDVYYGENAMELDHPDLRRFPFLYMVEPGYMTLTESQREGLRSYLLQGGFLAFDDFWGTTQYANFAWEMSLLLPEYEIVELPLDHPLFNTVYEIEEIITVPNQPNWLRGGMYEESGDREPWVHAIFDENGRLLVVAHVHTDIGDGMEHADDPRYPLEFSTYAFFMVMNMIVYALAN
jgi:hypothetical protein